jgi:serine/threonine-protein phosphatase 2A activator
MYSGVWGLDDYHCLIYVWGASQLLHHPDITPKDIHDPLLVRAEASEFMYLEGIQTIRTVKSSAPFYETSPMLQSISELSDWKAVKNGLHKLYLGEVSDKMTVNR